MSLKPQKDCYRNPVDVDMVATRVFTTLNMLARTCRNSENNDKRARQVFDRLIRNAGGRVEA